MVSFVKTIVLSLAAALVAAYPTKHVARAKAMTADAVLQRFATGDYNVDAATGYKWVCNSFNLKMEDLEYCRNYMFEIGDTPCVVDKPPKPAAHFVHSPSYAAVTGLSYNGKAVQTFCRNVGDTIQFLMDNCGTQGGSAVANHNGDLIVHVASGWVY